jgi:hypothetical protein
LGKPTNAAIVDLNGRKWNPFESTTPTGHVTYTADAGEIHVPYGTDPVSRTIQAHELSHVRYTAKVWPDVTEALKHLTALASTTNAIVGYAEDMRITALAGRLGVKTLPVFGNKLDAGIISRWVDSFLKVGVPEERAQAAIKFILNEHTTIVARIGLDLNTLQQKANAEAYIKHCAQHLHKLLERGEDSSKTSSDKSGKSDDKSAAGEPGPKGEKSEPGDDNEQSDDKSETGEGQSDTSDEGDDSAAGDDAGDDEGEGDSGDDSDTPAEDGDGDSDNESSTKGGDPGEGDGAQSGEADAPEVIDLTDLQLPDIRQAMLKSVPAPVDTQKLIQTFQHTLDTADWIPVKSIERKPLVRRAAQARNRGRKLSETGVVLGSAYDAVAPNERRPFIAKRKGGAGGLTVVIDCSASMHIEEAQLEQLLLTYPQGVVVTYSSYPNHCNRLAEKSVVRLIASHGRLAATRDFSDCNAGGNGCDGPVLEWLAKQSGERVWVCDGLITGHGDAAVPYDWQARDAWLKAHRITQFTSLHSYLASLTPRG